MLCSSYEPNYFSLVDIAVTEDRLPCKIERTIPKLGYLDSSTDTEDLKEGITLDLPFWLLSSFFSPRFAKAPIASLKELKNYNANSRDILEASPCTVILSKWSQHYYELGMYLTHYEIPEKEQIIESLLNAFKSRIKFIMDSTQNPFTDPIFISQLPVLERELYLTGRKAQMQLINWTGTGTVKIEASDVIVNMKKRKRAEQTSASL